MVGKIDKLGSAKRFGARYGTRPKYKFAKIEKEQRKKHKCPYCSRVQVKRISVGIWHCRKCNAKFTGKAYTISKSILFEKTEEEVPTSEDKVEVKEKTDENKEVLNQTEEKLENVEVKEKLDENKEVLEKTEQKV